LWDDANSGCEAETQAQAKAHTLAENEVPYVGGEGGADEGYAGKGGATRCQPTAVLVARYGILTLRVQHQFAS
jgi:hypothetical protein